MSKPITKNQFADLWLDEFASNMGFCCLCGNNGAIDSRGKIDELTGIEYGKLVYCICPNGRKLKKLNTKLEGLVK